MKEVPYTDTHGTVQVRVYVVGQDAPAQFVAQVVEQYTAILGNLRLDLETTGLDLGRDKPVTVTLAWGHGTARTCVLLDWRRMHDTDALGLPLVPPATQTAWRAALADLVRASEGARLVGHNIKFDLGMLAADGVPLWTLPWAGPVAEMAGLTVHDTMVTEQLLQGIGSGEARARFGGYNLKAVGALYGVTVEKEAREWFIGIDQRPDDWRGPLPDEQVRYAAQDVLVLGDIEAEQNLYLDKRNDEGLLERAYDIEMAQLPALARMEQHGVYIQVDGWRAVIDEQREQAVGFKEQTLRRIGPAMLDARMQAFDALWPDYRDWCARREEYEATAREVWDAAQQVSDTDPSHTGLSWPAFRKQWMDKWETDHPPPPEPDREKLCSLPNLNSDQQLLAAFQTLGLQVKRVDEKTLDRARNKLPEGHTARAAIESLFDWRGANKFDTTYGESLLALGVDAPQEVTYTDEEGVTHPLLVLHPTFDAIGAATGRNASNGPNFQNIPSRGEGDRLRASVVSPDGWWLLTADYPQIEIRVLENLSEDEALRDALAKDLHCETARRMLKLPPEWDNEYLASTVWKFGMTYRALGKMLNFRVNYGGTVYGLARTLNITESEAQDLDDGYHAAFAAAWARLQRFGNDLRTALENNQPLRTVTFSGRYRSYTAPVKPSRLASRWDWNEYEHMVEGLVRQAMNTPMQGGSADITKSAVGRFHHHTHDDPRIYLVGVVHDELLVLARDDAVEKAERLLKDDMRDAANEWFIFDPLTVIKVNVARRWAH